MDLYGCSVWNFGSNYVESCYAAWRNQFGLFGNYPKEQTATFFHDINHTLPIDVMLEGRCIKLIWTLLL